MAPNLSGISVRVLWANDPEAKFYGAGDLAGANLFVSPPICDAPGAAVSGFYIYAKGTDKPSAPFSLPVVPMFKLTAATAGDIYWYRDQPPTWNGVTLTAVYTWTADADKYTGSAWPASDADILTNQRTYTLKPDDTYPPVSVTDAGVVTVTVGKGLTATTPKIYEKNAKFSIKGYYKLLDFQYVGADGDWYEYEDPEKSYEMIGVNGTNSKALWDRMKSAKVKFRVLYDDGKDYFPLSWNEYEARMKLYGDIYTTPGGSTIDYNKFFFGGTSTEFGAGRQWLVLDDDSNWHFELYYLPKTYGDPGVYTGSADVLLPVYEFDQISAAQEKYKGATNIRVAWQSNPQTSLSNIWIWGATPASGNLVTAVNTYWQLTSTYRRSGQINKTRTVTFTDAMFQSFQAASASGGVNLKGRADSDIMVAVNAGGGVGAPGYGISSGLLYWDRDWYLPFRYQYRDGPGVFTFDEKDEDDAVAIDLFFLGQR